MALTGDHVVGDPAHTDDHNLIDQALATKQPLDSDLTAIAALTTAAFGRSLLELTDAAAGQAALELGTAATSDVGDFEVAGAAAAAQAASQPLDADLTDISALTTAPFGRGLLELADAADGRTALGLGTAAESDTGDFDAAGAAAAAQAASQPLDSDLTAIAALTTAAFGRALLEIADAAAGRTALGLGTAATQSTAAFDAAGAAAAAQAASQPLDSDLTSIAALATAAFGRSLLTLADAAAARASLVVARRSVLWQASQDYKVGEMVVYLGQPYYALDDHTSGASFVGSHWSLIVPGYEVAAMELGAEHVISTTTFANVVDTSAGSANWAILVPANSGAGRLQIPSVLVAATTGSGTAAGTSYNTQLEIVDEADARVVQGQYKPYSTATAVQVHGASIALCSPVIANNGSDKTYRVRGAMQQAGTNSAAGKVASVTGSSTTKPTLRYVRV